jgi:hypothetical protein
MSSPSFVGSIGVIRQITSEDEEKTGMFIKIMQNDRKRRQMMIEWLLELEENDDKKS